MEVQHIIAAGAAVKLSIDTDGWYRVPQAALAAAGLAANVDAASLQLWADGVEQPMVVTPSSSRWS
jgi:hypothetical protein